ncbi:hypothetical protein MUCCIDRAFT_82197 [Mucor lusitanicus CBS 277.49]|uniref:Uncharacterized protein n=1 Tax=Mucor lusitanicus CBS 277.49 TaxID=747725 RepID=A0A168JZU0_MUCCL|nr:hypothetical protein MUCCIDRAFT_82197 [Mucor lusitanicus CBS 277.49]
MGNKHHATLRSASKTYIKTITTSKKFPQESVKIHHLALGATVAHVRLESPNATEGNGFFFIHGIPSGKVSIKTRLTLQHGYRRPTVDTMLLSGGSSQKESAGGTRRSDMVLDASN